MIWRRELSKIRWLFRRNRPSNELDEEIGTHLRMEEQENELSGMSPEDARYAARRRFGNITLAQESSRDLWAFSSLEMLFQDLRYGTRMLHRNSGFTAVLVFALALGIGVNTAAFTAYKAIFGRTLDARDPEAMVNFAVRYQSGATSSSFSYLDYEAYRDHLHSFSGVIAVEVDQMKLTGTGRSSGQRKTGPGSLIGDLGLFPVTASNTEFASTFLVSENYFSVLGVPVLRGRSFESVTLSELAASPAVLISENYWQKRFAGDPAMLGKSVRLNGAAFTIVGITPRNFVGTSVAVPDFWLPLSLEPLVHRGGKQLRDRDDPCCRVYGRLSPGFSIDQAQAETSLFASHLRPLHNSRSEISKGFTVTLSPGSPLPGKMNAGLRLTIFLIMVAVGLVLVIACANAASLQLARATTRQQEMGMRLALGASRVRLIRQLLTENALLGFLAGCIALPLTWILLRVAVTRAAEALPLEFGTLVLHVNPDREIFAFVLGISVLASILFGLAPAIVSSGSALFSTIRGVKASSIHSRLRHLLIAAQVAVSLVLMIAGSMLVRSAIHALRMNTGYNDGHVVDLSLQFPEELKYSTAKKAALIRELSTRTAALPGVAMVTSARAPDDNGGRRAFVSLNGEPPSTRNMRASLYYTWVQDNYFKTLGIPLVSGCGLQSQTGQTEHSAILSQSAAQRLWPKQNPIGRSLRLGTDGQFHTKGELLPDGASWQVVGVVRDTRGVTLDGSDSQQVYMPLPVDRIQDYPILVRTHRDPAPVMKGMERMVSDVDPGLVASISTLQEMLRRTDAFLIDSTSAAIASTISLIGLLLAAMGIYSSVSYMVVLRTHEVGIRMAIGAQKYQILALMLRQSIRPVFAGLSVGMILAVGASHLLRGVLYGISTVDPVSFAGASLLFLAIALIATWLPSRRAMRVDPMVALRYE